MAEGGLRERSKARRRTAIIRAVYRLFAERGYDATTIADAAEVALCTVAMYFPSKQDIALSRFSESADTLTRRAGPPRSRRDGDAGCRPVAARQGRRAGGDGRSGSGDAACSRPTPSCAPCGRRGWPRPSARPPRPSPGTPVHTRRLWARIATAAASAIVIELGDSFPGSDREQAIITAMQFLEAGIATL
ncbi:MAG TPA: helix-turn-helix domain-containing protein [Streptosporangiaceae bacterium]|jgi:AcrR family transcriptional regulator|nr:helix-turn-helix domain-containing protein [Streptosporangiaceae bacterium]